MATAMASISVTRSRDEISNVCSGPTSASIPVAIPRTPGVGPASSSTRHLPYCPPGAVDAPPAGLSPGTSATAVAALSGSPQDSSDYDDSDSDDFDTTGRSLLFPPDAYERLNCGGISVYSIDADGLAAAVRHIAQQPLPMPSRVFPWLHGIHPRNNIQQAFFSLRQNGQTAGGRSCSNPAATIPIPGCLRSVTLVKADGNLGQARLKGALAPSDIIGTVSAKDRTTLSSAPEFEFLEVDPRTGFSVRNFHIQSVKMATISDIVVYGDDRDTVFAVARGIAEAQSRWRAKQGALGRHNVPIMNTFVCVTPFSHFEERHADIVSIDSAGHLTGNIIDFHQQERAEMYEMTKPTEIAPNVWLGPTPDLTVANPDEPEFDVFIECTDAAVIRPDVFRETVVNPAMDSDNVPTRVTLEFPASGSISLSGNDQSALYETVEVCKWIYHMANGTLPDDILRGGAEEADDVGSMCESMVMSDDGQTQHSGETLPGWSETIAKFGAATSKTSQQVPVDDDDDNVTEIDMDDNVGHSSPIRQPRKILLHCGDGYTETTLLAIAYYAFCTGKTIPKAWLDLHTERKRNFFAYPNDVTFLRELSYPLLRQSPACRGQPDDQVQILAHSEPRWFLQLDGSLPSRVTDYMYLGNLQHANNPDLLRRLGITQILSVGEISAWQEGELERWGRDNVCQVEGVQDNGVDTLTAEFERCFEFLDRARQQGKATLVHCRVGVSRSATVCIAEIMRTFNLSLPRAYCFVRARRLNVIIQPHLRFTYELLRWEEAVHKEHQGRPSPVDEDEGAETDGEFRRELEWAHIAREISLLNQPFLCR
ncbi:hypothetical protein TD95_004017 [Thielaviopsis punctulata]|uniref:Uncharacterized protein n=1 Tax=Thielaviopsis punctulata TaxID=72032 RepID=A0A0F4Z6W0_9PEZI|nr:hypothetical protein TD95_004017 [Thielaviopsis punctulata]